MAKSRKNAPARGRKRKTAPARRAAAKRPAAKTTKKAARKPARRAVKKAVAKPARKAAPRKAAKKAAPRKTAPAPLRKAKKAAPVSKAKAAPVSKAKKAAPVSKAKKAAPITKAKKAAPKPAAPVARREVRKSGPARRPPSLDRERRTIRDDDTIPGPPSSLDLDRSASAARSGRHEFAERLRQHTSTGPALTGGDVDADWEDAESVGDQAPGGDNPTPDQDIVEEIGEAIGITYEDNEELKGGDELVERDRHRWELDPASREDYDDED